MIRPILKLGDPKLREPAHEVPRAQVASEKIRTLIDDLIDTMRDACGAGIAATQIGEPHRVCVIEVGENPRYPYKPKIPLTVLINPRLTPLTEETFANYEGCLSVPNLRGVVNRFVGVRLEALDGNGMEIDRELWGLSAGTFQHELDHLDGLLFTDRVVDPASFTTWENFDLHHKAAFVQRVEALVSRFGA